MQHGYTEVGDERMGISRLEMYCEKNKPAKIGRFKWQEWNYVLVEQPQGMRLADWQTVPSMVDVVRSSGGKERKATSAKSQQECIITVHRTE